MGGEHAAGISRKAMPVVSWRSQWRQHRRRSRHPTMGLLECRQPAVEVRHRPVTPRVLPRQRQRRARARPERLAIPRLQQRSHLDHPRHPKRPKFRLSVSNDHLPDRQSLFVSLLSGERHATLRARTPRRTPAAPRPPTSLMEGPPMEPGLCKHDGDKRRDPLLKSYVTSVTTSTRVRRLGSLIDLSTDLARAERLCCGRIDHRHFEMRPPLES